MADHGGGPSATATMSKITVFCAACEVTWRGTVDDACWSCGSAAMVVDAPAPTVKVPS